MGSDDNQENDGLEILEEPKGVASVVTPIKKEDEPESFISLEPDGDGGGELDGDSSSEGGLGEQGIDVSDDGVEDLEEFGDVEELDIEELDEFELVEEDDEEEAQASAATPPKMPAPPPLPPRTPPPSRDIAPPADALEQTPPPSVRPAAPPPPSVAAAPLEFKLVEPAEVSALDALLEGRGPLDWQRRAEKLTTEISVAESKARVGELAYELGELYQRHLGDEASAVKAYGRALQSDPSLRANLWAIRRIFYRRKLWPNLVKLIGAELRFASSDRQRADLHLECGRILLDGVGDAKAAQESFEQALALEEDNHSALLALEFLAGQCGDSELLWGTLRQLATVCSRPERKVALLVELAREYRLADARLDEARSLLGEAAALDCLHGAVDREREALARHCDDSGALAAALEARIGRLQESFGSAGLPDADAAPEESGAGQRVREILALRREQAQVLASGGDDDGAWSCLHQALSLAPQEPLLLADLSDLAEKLGRYEELADLVAARESGEVDSGRAISLALRRASALAKAGKLDEADEVLASRARSTPGYLPLVVARELAAGTRRDWNRLAALQAETAETLRLGTAFGEGADCDPDPEMAAQHYVVSGDLLRFGAGDLPSAQERYTQALETHQGCAAAVDALVDLHVGARRHEDAAALLETQMESSAVKADLSRHAALGAQLVALYLLLRRPEDELRVVDGLLSLATDDVPLCGRRLELLRELKSREALSKAAVEHAELLADADAQASLYFEAGRIFANELGKPDEAAVCFEKCRERWPEDPIVAEVQLDALRKAGDAAALAACLRGHLERCSDEEAATLGREALAVVEFGQGDLASACELATQLCDRVPDNAPLLLDALAVLERGNGAVDTASAISDVLDRLVQATEGAVQLRALLRLGVVSHGLGRAAESEQAFQSAGEQGSVAGLLALHQGAADQGDAALQSEALANLASRVEAPEQRSSLLEQSAWDTALRGNVDEALQRFSSAREINPKPVGALLGLSLLSAKAQDQAAQGEFLEALAAEGEGPYAQSSMLLHAAMLAEVQGDEERAGERLRKARQIAPQDAGTAVMLADRLAPLSPEGGENVSDLLERAELCDMRSVLADAGSARVDWELERAEALELAGHMQEAIQAVSAVLDMRPGHIRGLQTLRRVCVRGGDRLNQAKACVALARQIGDTEGRVAMFREAAEIFDRELDDMSATVATYQGLLAEMPEAPEYERLVEILQNHGDIRNLYRAYSARLKYLSFAGEGRPRVPIFLARARLRKDMGDLRGATRDYAALLDVEPTHLDGLYERAQLLERLHEDREAAEHLKTFLEIEADPVRRATAELSLSHLMADSLDDLEGAIEQLEHVVRQSPHDLEVRERLLSLLVKAKRIDEAGTLLREMASMRATDGERARDELRIASLQREASNPKEAIKSLRRARQYDALNMDALRNLIELCGGEAKAKASLVASGVNDLRRAIGENPAEANLYEKLFIVGQWGEDEGLQRQALHALEMAEGLSANQDEISKKLGDPALSTKVAVPAETWRAAVLHRDAGGFAGQLWGVIGPAIAILSEGTPEGLGFERSQRIKERSVIKEMPEVSKFAGYLGLEHLEVYRSDTRGAVGRSVTGDSPTVCLGGDLVSAATAEHRFALGRCLAHAKAGTGSASDLADADLILYFAAAAELAGVDPLPSQLAERVDAAAVSAMARRMSKALGRRSRKELTLLGSRFSELGSPILWRQAAEKSAARVGLLVCGSLKAALDVLDVGKGGRPLADAPVGRDLMSWSVGEEFLELQGSGSKGGGKNV